MKKINNFKLLFLIVVIGFTSSCGNDEEEPNPSDSKGSALIIKNGAQAINKGESITFEAVFINQDGKETVPSDISWSSTNSEFSISSAGGISTSDVVGTSIITATASLNGKEYTTSTPLAVQDASAMAVLPGAVMWSVNAGTIPLSVVYLGTGTPSYSFSSSDESIASVSSIGEISFKKEGNCIITVSASGVSGNPSILVPVVVLGNISTALPVSRVEIYYNGVKTQSLETFRGQNVTANAKAYDFEGKEVSSTFTWAIDDTEIATVNSSGVVIGKKIGKTYVRATALGIIGQAEVNVYPDTVIVVTPFWVSNASANQTQQFSAEFHKFDLTTKTLNPTPITSPGAVNWELLPTAIITDFSDPFNTITSFTSPATITSGGMLTVKSASNIGDIILLIASYNSTIGVGVGTMTVGF